MIDKNRYYRRSKLSEAKFRQLVRHFALDLTATKCSALSGISIRSVNAIYLRIRVRMLEADESFWSFVKRRLAQFNGIAKHTFALHLKECEFRFSHRHDNLYLAMLKLLRENPL